MTGKEKEKASPQPQIEEPSSNADPIFVVALDSETKANVDLAAFAAKFSKEFDAVTVVDGLEAATWYAAVPEMPKSSDLKQQLASRDPPDESLIAMAIAAKVSALARSSEKAEEGPSNASRLVDRGENDHRNRYNYNRRAAPSSSPSTQSARVRNTASRTATTSLSYAASLSKGAPPSVVLLTSICHVSQLRLLASHGLAVNLILQVNSARALSRGPNLEVEAPRRPKATLRDRDRAGKDESPALPMSSLLQQCQAAAIADIASSTWDGGMQHIVLAKMELCNPTVVPPSQVAATASPSTAEPAMAGAAALHVMFSDGVALPGPLLSELEEHATAGNLSELEEHAGITTAGNFVGRVSSLRGLYAEWLSDMKQRYEGTHVSPPALSKAAEERILDAAALRAAALATFEARESAAADTGGVAKTGRAVHNLGAPRGAGAGGVRHDPEAERLNRAVALLESEMLTQQNVLVQAPRPTVSAMRSGGPSSTSTGLVAQNRNANPHSFGDIVADLFAQVETAVSDPSPDRLDSASDPSPDRLDSASEPSTLPPHLPSTEAAAAVPSPVEPPPPVPSETDRWRGRVETSLSALVLGIDVRTDCDENGSGDSSAVPVTNTGGIELAVQTLLEPLADSSRADAPLAKDPVETMLLRGSDGGSRWMAQKELELPDADTLRLWELGVELERVYETTAPLPIASTADPEDTISSVNFQHFAFAGVPNSLPVAALTALDRCGGDIASTHRQWVSLDSRLESLFMVPHLPAGKWSEHTSFMPLTVSTWAAFPQWLQLCAGSLGPEIDPTILVGPPVFPGLSIDVVAPFMESQLPSPQQFKQYVAESNTSSAKASKSTEQHFLSSPLIPGSGGFVPHSPFPQVALLDGSEGHCIMGPRARYLLRRESTRVFDDSNPLGPTVFRYRHDVATSAKHSVHLSSPGVQACFEVPVISGDPSELPAAEADFVSRCNTHLSVRLGLPTPVSNASPLIVESFIAGSSTAAASITSVSTSCDTLKCSATQDERCTISSTFRLVRSSQNRVSVDVTFIQSPADSPASVASRSAPVYDNDTLVEIVASLDKVATSVAKAPRKPRGETIPTQHDASQSLPGQLLDNQMGANVDTNCDLLSPQEEVVCFEAAGVTNTYKVRETQRTVFACGAVLRVFDNSRVTIVLFPSGVSAVGLLLQKSADFSDALDLSTARNWLVRLADGQGIGNTDCSLAEAVNGSIDILCNGGELSDRFSFLPKLLTASTRDVRIDCDLVLRTDGLVSASFGSSLRLLQHSDGTRFWTSASGSSSILRVDHPFYPFVELLAAEDSQPEFNCCLPNGTIVTGSSTCYGAEKEPALAFIDPERNSMVVWPLRRTATLHCASAASSPLASINYGVGEFIIHGEDPLTVSPSVGLLKSADSVASLSDSILPLLYSEINHGQVQSHPRSLLLPLAYTVGYGAPRHLAFSAESLALFHAEAAIRDQTITFSEEQRESLDNLLSSCSVRGARRLLQSGSSATFEETEMWSVVQNTANDVERLAARAAVCRGTPISIFLRDHAAGVSVELSSTCFVNRAVKRALSLGGAVAWDAVDSSDAAVGAPGDVAHLRRLHIVAPLYVLPNASGMLAPLTWRRMPAIVNQCYANSPWQPRMLSTSSSCRPYRGSCESQTFTSWTPLSGSLLLSARTKIRMQHAERVAIMNQVNTVIARRSAVAAVGGSLGRTLEEETDNTMPDIPKTVVSCIPEVLVCDETAPMLRSVLKIVQGVSDPQLITSATDTSPSSPLTLLEKFMSAVVSSGTTHAERNALSQLRDDIRPVATSKRVSHISQLKSEIKELTTMLGSGINYWLSPEGIAAMADVEMIKQSGKSEKRPLPPRIPKEGPIPASLRTAYFVATKEHLPEPSTDAAANPDKPVQRSCSPNPSRAPVSSLPSPAVSLSASARLVRGNAGTAATRYVQPVLRVLPGGPYHPTDYNRSFASGLVAELSNFKLQPHKLDFGEVSAGWRYSMSVSILNTGTGPLRINAVLRPDSRLFKFKLEPTGPIAAGRRLKIDVFLHTDLSDVMAHTPPDDLEFDQTDSVTEPSSVDTAPVQNTLKNEHLCPVGIYLDVNAYGSFYRVPITAVVNVNPSNDPMVPIVSVRAASVHLRLCIYHFLFVTSLTLQKDVKHLMPLKAL